MSDCIPNRKVILNCFKEYFEFRKQIDWFIDSKLHEDAFRVLEYRITEEGILKFEFWSDFYYELLEFQTSPLQSHSHLVIESAYFKYIILDTFSRFLLPNGTSIPYQLENVICPAITMGGLLCYFNMHKSEIFLKEYEMDLIDAEDSFQEIEFLNTIDRFENAINNFNRQVVPLYNMTLYILDSRFKELLNSQKTQDEFFITKRKILNTFSQNEFFNLFNPFDRLKREIEIFSENLDNLSFIPPEVNIRNLSNKNRSFKIRNFESNRDILIKLFPYSKIDEENLDSFLELFNGSQPINSLIWKGKIGDLKTIVETMHEKNLLTGLTLSEHWLVCTECFRKSDGDKFTINKFTSGKPTNNMKTIRGIIYDMNS